VITAADLDFGRRPGTPAPPMTVSPSPLAAAGLPLTERLQEEERRSIIDAIERAHGNIASAARTLGINRSTLYYRLRKHDLEHLLPTKPGEDEAG
jgi:transcriptional regulator of acetoin/glycerol metabolism